jgi:hypothetical protein|tara:strand:+ start:97 stop:321 length:225 start_codon:yes stop_codon:yes gene_type:complete
LVKVITVPGEILDALAREYDVAAKVGLTTKAKAKAQNRFAIVDRMACMTGFLNSEELNDIKPKPCLQIEIQAIH